MKKLISSFAVLCLCAVLLLAMPVMANAESSGDWEYTVSAGQATVTKYNGTDAVVTVPETFEDLYQVVAIGPNAFKGNTTMTQIVFPKKLTSIGERAFEGCVALTELTLPETLKTLGAFSFQGCTKLSKITVLSTALEDIAAITRYGDIINYSQPFYTAGTAGDGIEVVFVDGSRVPANMFYAYSGADTAPNITSVTFEDGVREIGASAFNNCPSLVKIDLGTVSTIGASSFQNCTGLNDITWSEDLATIGASAFKGCTKIATLDLPKGLTTISDDAFNGCTNLSSLSFPKKLSTIGARAFMECLSLTELTLNEGLTNIGTNAFQSCTKLNKITVQSTALEDIKPITRYGDIINYDQPFYTAGTAGDGIEVIFANTCTRVPANMFYAYSGTDTAPNIISVTFEDGDENGVSEVGANAFRNCASIEKVDFGSAVTIGSSAFENCTALKDFTWSDKLTTIGASAFKGCTKIATLDLPKGLTTISDDAFSGCTRLSSLSFPKGLYTIGARAFMDCTSLTELTLNEDLASIGTNAFQSCTKLTKITVLSKALEDIKPITRYGDIINYDQPFYTAGTAADGISVIFADSCTRIPANMFYAYSGADTAPNIISVSISDDTQNGASEIGSNAFRNCASLESVDFGSIVTVGSNAFENCTGLKTFTWSEKLTTIGSAAFKGCTKIAALKLPGSLTTIDSEGFNGCTNLATIEFPAGLTAIGDNAFLDCVNLTEITLPEKLSSLGKESFKGCTGVTAINVNSVALADIDPLKRYGDIIGYEQPFYGVGTAGGGVTVTFSDACSRIPANMFHAYSGVDTSPVINKVFVGNGVVEIGNNAFTNCDELTEIRFTGNSPIIASNIFGSVVATAYHPGWDTSVQQDYGGTITWVLSETCTHAETKLANEKAADCVNAGYTGDKVCTVCGEVVESGTATDALGHSFGEYVSDGNATCTADGTKTAKCGREGCAVTDTIADEGSATGHKYEDGKCSRCDEADPEYKEDPCAKGHSFTNYVSDGNATCTADGTKTAKCDREGCTATDTVADEGSATGHKYENGKCTQCGEADPDYKEEPCTKGHSYGKWTITKMFYCTEDGKLSRSCSVCGETEEFEVAAIGHKFTRELPIDYYLKSAATETEPAVYFKSCACGEKGTETFVYGDNKPEDEEPLPDVTSIVLRIDDPTITVNGVTNNIDTLGTTPVILNDRTLLPIRCVIEAMGGSVQWDPNVRTVELTVKEKVLTLKIDSNYMWDDNETIYIDTPPTIIGDRTMVPLRAVVEYFGATINWDGSTRIITINYENK